MATKEKFQVLFENYIKEESWVTIARNALSEIEFTTKKVRNPKFGQRDEPEFGYAKFVKIDPKTGRRSDQEELKGIDYPSSEPELRQIVQDLKRQQGDDEGADAVGVLAMTPDETIEKGREDAAAEREYFDQIKIGDETEGKGFQTKVIDKDPNTFSITWAVKYDGEDEYSQDDTDDVSFSDAEDLAMAFIKKDQ